VNSTNYGAVDCAVFHRKHEYWDEPIQRRLNSKKKYM
jgi:hypothetical protein